MGETTPRTRSARRSAADQAVTIPSPLDPFLGQLLIWADQQPAGISQSAAGTAAEAFGWPPSFADAVFTSARVRGLISPFYGKGTRGRAMWQISKRGRAWLNSNSALSE